ncbi:MAG: hypothetical protein PHD32_12005 [Eubacteriales bacterium]|nr:hypothetical protein [Eubacteriales bacterium]
MENKEINQSEHRIPCFSWAQEIPSPFLRHHPHSAFTRRKNAQGELLTALYTPAGKMTCRSGAQGAPEKPFLQLPRDVIRLHSFLKDIEYVPAPHATSAVWHLGKMPQLELREDWGASPELAKAAADELEACFRQLKHLLYQRAQAAARSTFMVIDAGEEEIPFSAYEKLQARCGTPLLVRGKFPRDGASAHVMPLAVWGSELPTRPFAAQVPCAALPDAERQNIVAALVQNPLCQAVLLTQCKAEASGDQK